MAGEEVIGKGKVQVSADTSSFDKDMAAMPGKGAAAMDATERAMEARARANSRARDERGRFIGGGGGGADSLLGTQLEAKLQRVGDAGIEAGQKIHRGGSNAAMGLMMVSQFVDDAQYGFRSVVNNIPSLGMAVGSALGMSSEAAMKFGGSLGIAAVAVNVLITHWDSLTEAMGLGRVLTQAEEMEKLASATRRTADEQERLNRFKREGKIIEEMSGRLSSGQQKTEAEIEAAYADFGVGNRTGFDLLVSGLAGSRQAQGVGTKENDSDREKMAEGSLVKKGAPAPQFLKDAANWFFGAINSASRGVIPDYRQKEVKEAEIKQRLQDEDIERAKRTVAGAVFDPLKRQELINEIRKNPGAFPPGAADKLEGIKPAKNTADQQAADLAARQAEQLDAANKADYDRYKQQRDAEDARLAGAMTGSVGQSLLNNPKMNGEQLEKEVEAAMKRAGMSAGEIAKALDGTAKKLRENMDRSIKERSLDRGISEDQARQQLAKEAADRDRKLAMAGMKGTGEFTSGADEIFRKMQLAATAEDVRRAQGEDTIPAEQLKVEKEMAAYLEKINDSLKHQKQPVARFGGKK